MRTYIVGLTEERARNIARERGLQPYSGAVTVLSPHSIPGFRGTMIGPRDVLLVDQAATGASNWPQARDELERACTKGGTSLGLVTEIVEPT